MCNPADSSSHDNAPLLNQALALALEWGADWLRPIHDRLRGQHPAMTQAEADVWDRRCREIMRVAFAICQTPREPAELKQEIARRYPLLDEPSLNRLVSQGIYYARK